MSRPECKQHKEDDLLLEQTFKGNPTFRRWLFITDEMVLRRGLRDGQQRQNIGVVLTLMIKYNRKLEVQL